MAKWDLRDKVCIVGIGTTPYGSFEASDTYGLGRDALLAALDDAGLQRSQVDGLIVNRIPSYERFAYMMGIEPQYCLETDSPGRFSAVSVMLATQAIASGAADTVALVYANNGRSQRVFYGGDDGSVWNPWGMSSPGATHAMMWRDYMHRYGCGTDGLGHVAVTFRKHAMRNPSAVMRKPITLDDHRNARPICEPLRLLDYCLINDGAVALILTSAERARDLRKPPVYVSGYVRSDTYDEMAPRLDYWHPVLQDIASKIYDRAGVSRDEIDGLMIYDNFSPTVLFTLEGLGFCKPGEASDFVASGALELGRGRWPTNTSGGHLSESYMQGWALIAQSVRQLRGECGDFQIPNARAIQYGCATNISSSIIFRKD